MSQAQYAAEIAKLIQQQGEGQADAIRQSGQIWGNLANNLGQLPTQLVGMQRAKDEAALRKVELQQKQTQINGEQALNDSMKNALVTNPDGTTTFNQNAVIGHLTAAGFGSKVPAYQKMMSDADTAAATLAKTKADVATKQSDLKGALAASVKEQGYDVPSFTLMVSHATAQKLITPQEGQQALQMAIDNPESVKKLTDTWLAASPGQQKLGIEKQTADARTQTAQTGVQNSVSLAQSRQVEAENKTADNARLDAQATETGRHNKVMENAAMIRAKRPPAAGAAPVKSGLSDEAINQAADKFHETGVLPSSGMGNQAAADKRAIMNRAAERHPGAQLAANSAEYKANSSTLTKLENQRATIGAFEQTAQKNIDLFLDQAGKVVDTGSPLANTFIRAASGKVIGSPDQAAYDAARQVAINEIAKVTQGGGLSGVLSDSARHEIASFNPSNATLKQTVAVVRLLKQDMANRTAGLDDQIATIKGRLGSTTTAAPAAAPAAAGRMRVVGPNGETGSVPAGSALPAGWKKQ